MLQRNAASVTVAMLQPVLLHSCLAAQLSSLEVRLPLLLATWLLATWLLATTHLAIG